MIILPISTVHYEPSLELRAVIYFDSSPSAATKTFFSSSILANSPLWCIATKISHPPTNSLSTYNCGIVGHSEYSLMPANPISHNILTAIFQSIHFGTGFYLPALKFSSSKTLKAVNFCGSTPWRPKICILALEKPHCGVSGVPFMKSTTGAVATALSIACLVSSVRNLLAMGDILGATNLEANGAGRAACRKAWEWDISIEDFTGNEFHMLTDDSAGLANIISQVYKKYNFCVAGAWDIRWCRS